MFQMQNFYRKRVTDYIDAQRPDGGFTETSPYVGIDDNGLGANSGPIGWDSIPILVMHLYREYGDISLVQESYNAITNWIRFLVQTSTSLIEHGLSDWMNVETGGNVQRLTGHVFLYVNLKSFSEMSNLLGHDSWGTWATSMAQGVMQNINNLFLADDGTYTDHTSFNLTQCGQAMPLYHNLVPENARDSVMSKLYDSLGTPQVLRVGMFCMGPLLSSLNISTAYKIAVANSDYPSFGYMLNQNATTVWESWFYSNNTFSHNHPMFGGGLASWMIRDLAGISQREWSVAYSHIWFRPRSPCHLDPDKGDMFDGVNVTFRSPVRDDILSIWSLSEKTFEFVVPQGAVADVDLPDRETYLVGPGAYVVNDVDWC